MRTEVTNAGRAAGAAGAGAGAAVVTSVATACCAGPVIAPLFVGVLGTGGAVWAAGLRPYSSYVLAASGALLAYAFRTLYRSRPACAAGEKARGTGGLMWPRRLALGIAWIAAAVWTAAVVLNVALP